MRCGEDHEVGCGPCGRAVQAEPLVVNPGNTAWRFGHCTFKTPIRWPIHKTVEICPEHNLERQMDKREAIPGPAQDIREAKREKDEVGWPPYKAPGRSST